MYELLKTSNSPKELLIITYYLLTDHLSCSEPRWEGRLLLATLKDPDLTSGGLRGNTEGTDWGWRDAWRHMVVKTWALGLEL